MSWPSPLFDPKLRNPFWSPSEGQDRTLSLVYQAVAKKAVAEEPPAAIESLKLMALKIVPCSR